MTYRIILCLAIIGLLLPGCGRRDAPPTTQKDYERYFSKKRPVPKDLSVKLAAMPIQPAYAPGGAVEINMVFANMSKRPRRLPLGLETDEGFVYTFLSALVRNEAGTIEKVSFSADEGTLVALDLGKYSNGTHEPLALGDFFNFEEPGRYEVVIFYTVEDKTLPDGKKPEWTGTVWSSKLGIVIQ